MLHTYDHLAHSTILEVVRYKKGKMYPNGNRYILDFTEAFLFVDAAQVGTR